MTQQELFSPAYNIRKIQVPAPSVPVQTSIEAAERITPDAATLRGLVFGFIRGRGQEGATREEISIALEMSENTVRPRVWELLGAKQFPKLIQVNGKRKVLSGNWAEVLVAME